MLIARSNMFKASRVMWLFLLVAPAALAQSGGSEAPSPILPSVDLSSPQRARISSAEILDRSREYRQQIGDITLKIQAQTEQAKGEKDIIRLACLLDKLNQVKANGNIMDQSLQTLQECISRRDEGAELHEYMRITIINQKAQVLRAEADACVGAESNYIGPTKVAMETPQGLQDSPDQPTLPVFPPAVIERPPVTSPYK
jgi:hypothetical protein